jgi:hypothetical protein
MMIHDKRAAFGDTADATDIQASDWNADHLHPPFLIHQLCATKSVWGGSTGVNEVCRNAGRALVNLRYVHEVMLMFFVNEGLFNPPDTTTYWTCEYSLDMGINWARIGADGIAPRTFYAPWAPESVHISEFEWADVAPRARTEVMLRFVTVGEGGFVDTLAISLWGR